MDLDEAITNHVMADTFGGYDWGDPIRLWYPPRVTREFSVREIEIATTADAARCGS